MREGWVYLWWPRRVEGRVMWLTWVGRHRVRFMHCDGYWVYFIPPDHP